jgi:lipid-A-disaccharide synthase
MPCTYVGHPIIERLGLIASLDRIGFGARHGLDLERPVIVVLPGSRRSEVERLMGVFGETVVRVASHQPGLQVLIPAMPTVKGIIEDELALWPKGEWTAKLIAGEDDAEKFSAFKRARAALAASGTVTLELALTRTPMVVAYKVDAVISALRHLIKTQTSVLPNLITGEFGVPEFHQEACTPEALADALEPLIRDTPERALQLEHLDKVPARLALADGTPSATAARVVLEVLRGRQ